TVRVTALRGALEVGRRVRSARACGLRLAARSQAVLAVSFTTDGGIAGPAESGRDVTVGLLRRAALRRRGVTGAGLPRPGHVTGVRCVARAGAAALAAAVAQQRPGEAGGEVDSKLMLVMNMLALTSLAPKLASSPPSVAIRAKTTDRAATAKGRADNRWAAAARVMARLSTSRVPTTWAAPVTVRASTSRNTGTRRRTGTPRASTASGSTEANSKGRTRRPSRRRRSGR